jgi:hypothetical protein
VRREIKAAIQQKPKVIIYDPSEAVKKELSGFMAGVRNELGEIRHALNLRRMTDPPDDQKVVHWNDLRKRG